MSQDSSREQSSHCLGQEPEEVGWGIFVDVSDSNDQMPGCVLWCICEAVSVRFCHWKNNYTVYSLCLETKHLCGWQDVFLCKAACSIAAYRVRKEKGFAHASS